MPILQRMTGRINTLTNTERIPELKASHADAFADPSRTLEDLFEELGVTAVGPGAAPAAARTFLENLPAGIKAAIKAVVATNLARDEPWEMTFAWTPAYDYGLTVHEAPATTVSPAGITVIVQSRYPLDEHPSTIRPASAS